MREHGLEKIRLVEAPVDVRDAGADLEELVERFDRTVLRLCLLAKYELPHVGGEVREGLEVTNEGRNSLRAVVAPEHGSPEGQLLSDVLPVPANPRDNPPKVLRLRSVLSSGDLVEDAAQELDGQARVAGGHAQSGSLTGSV